MWRKRNQDEQRRPRDLIGHDPLTPENVRARIAVMFDLGETLDDPWAAGASLGLITGLRDAGILSDTDHALFEAEHAVRIGKGCRWLDKWKAAHEGRRD